MALSSLLSLPIVQQAIAAAVTASNLSATSKYQKSEQGFVLFQVAGGGYLIKQGAPAPGDGVLSAYQANLNFPGGPAGSAPLLYFHTHPFTGPIPETGTDWNTAPESCEVAGAQPSAAYPNGLPSVIQAPGGVRFFYP